MTSDEPTARLKRIYASINARQEFDMQKLPARIIQNERAIVIRQDFSGEMSEEEMLNFTYSVIHNIAHFQDHLRKWAKINGKDMTKIDVLFDSSHPLKIIKDLSNNDKHGYPPRNGGGCSGLAPKLPEIGRIMQLSTGEGAGSNVTMTLGAGGVPIIRGSGTGCAIITGDVVDKDGNILGDLFKIEKEAVEALEALLKDLGAL